jgi:hypothetical protein
LVIEILRINMKKTYWKNFLYFTFIIYTLTSCNEDPFNKLINEYPNIENKDIVYIINDTGCSTCKESFFKWINSGSFEDSKKFIIHGKLKKETEFYYPQIFKHPAVFHDSTSTIKNYVNITNSDEIVIVQAKKKPVKYSYLNYNQAMLIQ